MKDQKQYTVLSKIFVGVSREHMKGEKITDVNIPGGSKNAKALVSANVIEEVKARRSSEKKTEE